MAQPMTEADKAALLDSLHNSGLHTFVLSDDPLIINVHSAPVSEDGSGDDESYLYTITGTTTE
jgi:hypothetical protein